MKTLIRAPIRCSLMFTAVAALSFAYPASEQAVPTTYEYTGNPFIEVNGPYTTSMFVTAMVTLAAPLEANMPLTTVSPTAFIVSDGVQTITNLTSTFALFAFGTGPTGAITLWEVVATSVTAQISTSKSTDPLFTFDLGISFTPATEGSGVNNNSPGIWSRVSVSDAASTLSLLSLSLMALGLVARRFQRAAA